jgi:hypothetical protein
VTSVLSSSSASIFPYLPDHTGKLGVAVGQSEIERRTVLVEVSNFSDTADAIEGRRLLDDRCDLVV